MKIAEVIDSAVDSRLMANGADLFVTRAKIDGQTIDFTARRTGENAWTIEFKPAKSGLDSMKPDRPQDYLKTNRGSELKVFSFVKQSLDQFNTLRSPDSISFTADKSEPNRAQLYQRMVDRWSKQQGFSLDTAQSKQLTVKNPTHQSFVLNRAAGAGSSGMAARAGGGGGKIDLGMDPLLHKQLH